MTEAFENLLRLDSYDNCKAAEAGNPYKKVFEYPLYTDVGEIAGQIIPDHNNKKFPFEILNLCNISKGKILLPRLVLRIYDHLPSFDYFSSCINPTDTPQELVTQINWHEQIAVLLSLILGIRLKAGDLSREIDVNPLQLGVPRGFAIHENPLPMKFIARNPILPTAVNFSKANNLFDLRKAKKRFIHYSKIDKNDAIALINCAKLYRDALWMVESETNLSWIMLVSAIETSAIAWHKNESDLKRFQNFIDR